MLCNAQIKVFGKIVVQIRTLCKKRNVAQTKNLQFIGAKPFKCNQCEKVFSKKHNLYKHVNAVHEGSQYN